MHTDLVRNALVSSAGMEFKVGAEQCSAESPENATG
jgi:hypothetical protein